ncbi:hypothetical protein FRC15_006577 [Serendipita sp. 397]|nr:hypothetical protein FRC15_006577 [Serendipita sp. 397]
MFGTTTSSLLIFLRNDSIQNRSVCDPNHCSTPYDQQKTSAIIRISHHHQVSASIDTWNVTFHSWKRYSNIENGNFYSQPNSVLELSLIYDGGPDKGVKEQINDFDISKDFHIELKQLTYGVIRSPVYNLLMAEFLHWTSLFNHPPQDISAILGVTTNIPRKWRDPL